MNFRCKTEFVRWLLFFPASICAIIPIFLVFSRLYSGHLSPPPKVLKYRLPPVMCKCFICLCHLCVFFFLYCVAGIICCIRSLRQVFGSWCALLLNESSSLASVALKLAFFRTNFHWYLVCCTTNSSSLYLKYGHYVVSACSNTSSGSLPVFP